MAKSYVVYQGGASVYSFPFDYLSKQFIKVRTIATDGSVTDLTYGSGYTVVDKSVHLSTAVPTESRVRIFRKTATTPITVFNDASILRAKDLNAFDVQLLHLSEESQDSVEDAGIALDDADGKYNAKMKVIKNVADGTADYDVANIKQVTAIAGSASAAATSAAEALASANKAEVEATKSENQATISTDEADKAHADRLVCDADLAQITVLKADVMQLKVDTLDAKTITEGLKNTTQTLHDETKTWRDEVLTRTPSQSVPLDGSVAMTGKLLASQGIITPSVEPATDNTGSVGSSTKKFQEGHFDTLSGNHIVVGTDILGITAAMVKTTSDETVQATLDSLKGELYKNFNGVVEVPIGTTAFTMDASHVNKLILLTGTGVAGDTTVNKVILPKTADVPDGSKVTILNQRGGTLTYAYALLGLQDSDHAVDGGFLWGANPVAPKVWRVSPLSAKTLTKRGSVWINTTADGLAHTVLYEGNIAGGPTFINLLGNVYDYHSLMIETTYNLNSDTIIRPQVNWFLVDNWRSKVNSPASNYVLQIVHASADVAYNVAGSIGFVNIAPSNGTSANVQTSFMVLRKILGVKGAWGVA